MNLIAIFRRKPLVVNHVRYVKAPVISPRAKAHAMALQMGRLDLAAKLEGVTHG